MPAISARRCSTSCSRGEPGGRLILRLDDTDQERSTEEFAHGIEEDLALARRRMGQQGAAVGPVRPLCRSGREAEGERPALSRLRDAGGARAEAQAPARPRQAAGLRPRRLEADCRGRAPSSKRRGASRIGGSCWSSAMWRGTISCAGGSMSMPPRCRTRCWSGQTAPISTRMPSVVDDIDLGITHVIRGEDHVANTAPQIQLFEALGATPPAFGHHNLLVGADGQALSKRDRTLSIAALREEGIEALAVASYVGDDRHLRSGRAARQSRRAGAWFRFRQVVAGAGAVRSERAPAAQCQAAAHAAVQRGGGPARRHGRRRRRGVLGCG